jgi:hypothetical protein
MIDLNMMCRYMYDIVYAIGSRDDIDWNGLSIDSEEEREAKRAELHGRWLQTRLYDWTRGDAPMTRLEETLDTRLTRNGASACEPPPIWVTSDDIQTTLEKAARRHGGKRLAWVNLVNAQCVASGKGEASSGWATSVGGVASAVVGVNALLPPLSAEFDSEAAAASDASVVLGLLSDSKSRRMRDACHLPPGGSVFAPTRFVTSDPPIDVFMIASAPADFDAASGSFSERPYFFSSRSGLPRNIDDVTLRVVLDIGAILKTAILQNIDVLVLDVASAARVSHDVAREAALWATELQRFGAAFDEVVFAAPPSTERPPQVIRTFVDQFTDRPPAAFLDNDDMESLPDYM